MAGQYMVLLSQMLCVRYLGNFASCPDSYQRTRGSRTGT